MSDDWRTHTRRQIEEYRRKLAELDETGGAEEFAATAIRRAQLEKIIADLETSLAQGT